MSEAILITQHDLRKLVTEAVHEAINPWLTMDNMMTRYYVKKRSDSARESWQIVSD